MPSEPAKYDVKDLEADRTVSGHFVGESDFDGHQRLVVFCRGHNLSHIVRETARQEQDHSVESSHVSDEVSVLAEETGSEPATLNGRRVGHIVLVEGTVGAITEGHKV